MSHCFAELSGKRKKQTNQPVLTVTVIFQKRPSLKMEVSGPLFGNYHFCLLGCNGWDLGRNDNDTTMTFELCNKTINIIFS